MNMDEILALFRATHNEPVDPAHYTAVRSRVVAEIERTRAPWRRFAWISGVGAMAAVLLFAIWFAPALRRPDVAPPPRVAIAIPPAPAAPAVLQPRAVPVAHARPARPPHREPLTIKLQTSDPNIVIYWIAD